MRSPLFNLLCLCLLLQAGSLNAQISGPSAAVAGAAVTFTGPAHKKNYTWSLEPKKLTMPVASSTVRSTVVAAAQITAVITLNDNGNWYTFTITENDRTLRKISHGVDPTAAGTLSVVLSGFSPANYAQMGFDIIKDSISGEWFGFFVVKGSDNITRLDFGSSLANTPTAVSYPVRDLVTIAELYKLSIVRDNNEYIAFIGNRSNGKVIRIDIGPDIKNTTLQAIELPATPEPRWNTGLSLYKYKGDWYGFSTTTGNQHLYRFEFGPSLKNNTPTITQVGTNVVGGTNNWNHSILPSDCGEELRLLVSSGNNIRILDFPGGDPTATPTATAGIMTANLASTLSFGLYPYAYNGKIYATVSCLHNSGGIYNIAVANLPASTLTRQYNENTFNHTFTTPGTYTISLLTNAAGQGAENVCHTITITAPSTGLPQPGAFTAAPASVCHQQNNVTYTVPAVAGATKYVWNYIGTGVTYTASTTQPSNTLSFPTGATSGTLQVWGVNNSDDSSIASRDVSITVNPVPTVTINPATAAVCVGDAVTLTAAGATTYSWSNSGGSNAAATFSPTATTTYTVTGTALGCSATVSRQVTVHSLPNVQITPASAAVCAGESVTLTASGANSYSWSHGGGGNAAATFTPSSTTSYIVTGTDANNCKKADTAEVTYHPLPVVQITIPGGVTDICESDSVTLEASGTGYNYTWKNEAGQTVGQNQTYKAHATGSYTVVASDVVSGCSDSATSVDIRVFARPSVALDQNDTAFCIGGVVMLEVATTDTGLTYVWKKDDVVNPSATASFLEVDEEGIYKVIVGRQGVQSCEDSTNEVAITVHPLPVVSASWDGERLSATPGFVSYQWYVSGQAVPGGQDSILIPTSDGGYTVTVVDDNGCENTSAAVQASNVGISSFSNAAPLYVYPNPTTGFVRIASAGMVDVKIAGMDGRLIREYTQVQSLDLGNYAAGIYLLSITDKTTGQSGHIRLIKE